MHILCNNCGTKYCAEDHATCPACSDQIPRKDKGGVSKRFIANIFVSLMWMPVCAVYLSKTYLNIEVSTSHSNMVTILGMVFLSPLYLLVGNFSVFPVATFIVYILALHLFATFYHGSLIRMFFGYLIFAVFMSAVIVLTAATGAGTGAD